MNWGYRLVVVFAGFAALIGTLVYKATHTKYELVSKDYYRDELRYQEKIDGINNAVAAGDLAITREANGIRLTLPASLSRVDSADAWFYCKTNASSDRKLRIAFNSGTAVVDAAALAADAYELKLQVNMDNKPYYYTKPVDLR